MGIITMAVRRILFAALFVSALFAFTLADDAATPMDVDAPSEEDEFDPVKDGTKEMEEMDADKDGKATLEEVKKFMKERYYSKEEDLKDLENDDGKPATPEDIVKMIERDASELVTELDKDKSGDLSLEEVIAQYKDDGSEMEEPTDMPEGEEDAEAEAGAEDAE